MKFIDNFLNKITMYRLVLYYLIILVVIAVLYSLIGILPFTFILLMLSVVFLITISWITNSIFAKTFKVPANVESVYISSLILALIITPPSNLHELMFLGWAAVWTMASKYILAIGKKHIFNPVAIAVFITAYTLNQSASWWIGNLPMMPFVFLGGILIVRKIKRYDLITSFLFASIAVVLGSSLLKGTNLILVLQKTFLYSPLLFFTFVMLTEPLTTPPTNRLQIYYGAFVGLLFAPQIHFGPLYTTPETALLIGNIFSYIASSKEKMVLKLKEKIQIAPSIYDLVFATDKKMAFLPGQYMEWTLGHPHPDARGNRRYFTLASSPTEDDIRIGVKFYDTSSSFKKTLLAMDNRSEIIASQLSGDFVLPENPDAKCVFIAGGIGITPFRSMVKHLLDNHQKRSIVLFYANRNTSEIVYSDVFDKARQELGIKTIYTLTDRSSIPIGWQGMVGYINEQMIQTEVPDYAERIFYLSGPQSLVTSAEEILKKIGVKREQIRTDSFPGFV